MLSAKAILPCFNEHLVPILPFIAFDIFIWGHTDLTSVPGFAVLHFVSVLSLATRLNKDCPSDEKIGWPYLLSLARKRVSSKSDESKDEYRARVMSLVLI